MSADANAELAPDLAYSGIYDPSTGHFEARRSDRNTPGGILPRRGGHEMLNNGMFDGSQSTVGFTAVIQEGGGLHVTWLSRGVTGRNFPTHGGFAPPEHRAAILGALRTATGRRVTGD